MSTRALEIKPRTPKCANCGEEFDRKDNPDNACSYHPGATKTTTHVRSFYDETTFECCGVTNRGSTPQQINAHGCQKGPHITAAQLKDIQQHQHRTQVNTPVQESSEQLNEDGDTTHD
eukprot:GFYU01006175.1.p3 GENE.GFYU01006175.1~~GFYU01006175.1.p3  ORF type:complete len:118 (+),score=25.76 GFYU01006175.1:126-479(+)